MTVRLEELSMKGWSLSVSLLSVMNKNQGPLAQLDRVPVFETGG